jgi:hypothetical protein
VIDPPEAVNRFKAKVTDVTFLGNSSELLLDLGGIIIRAQVPPTDTHNPGDDIVIGLPVEGCLIMPNEAG